MPILSALVTATTTIIITMMNMITITTTIITIMNMVMMSLKVSFCKSAISRDGEAFKQRLSDVARAHQILRAKGAMQIAGKALPLIVQAVGSRVDSYFASQQAPNIGRLSSLA